MNSKFTNDLIDFITLHKANSQVYKMWGGEAPASMGDGVRFRVTRSPKVDYVYVRYLSGFEQFEVEFGALVGTDYDVLDKISPVKKANLMATISRKIFFEQ